MEALQLKIGKNKKNNNNEGCGTCQNLITVQCFSMRRYYSTCLFLGNTIYCYLLKTVKLPHGLVTCKLYDTRGYVSSTWCVGVSSKKTSLYNFHYGHSPT